MPPQLPTVKNYQKKYFERKFCIKKDAITLKLNFETHHFFEKYGKESHGDFHCDIMVFVT